MAVINKEAMVAKVKTLRERIRGRIKQAEERRIQEKAEQVAVAFGVRHPINHTNRRGSRYVIRESSLEGLYINYDDTLYISSGEMSDMPCGGVTIGIGRGKIVFKTEHPKIISYIPGSWERILESLYRAAKRKQTSKKAFSPKRKRSDRAKRAKWGL